MSTVLVAALRNCRADLEPLIEGAPDWSVASRAFDALFRKMADPVSPAWPTAFIDTLHETYSRARDDDKDCTSIIVRTVNAMPAARRNDTKKVMLEIASVCRVFNAANKVHFTRDELPRDFDEVPMRPSTKKDALTYEREMPSLYPRTSLTLDYWVPKLLDWTRDIRAERISEWRNGAATSLDSCTDFMSVCIAFLADPRENIPIAKADDREALLRLLGEPFIWKRRSAKREDIAANSAALTAGLARVSKSAGIAIPVEAWSRVQHVPSIRALLK
jgi:hypothetical protein